MKSGPTLDANGSRLRQRETKGKIGDVWTWVAIDADTKLICSWLVGKRDIGSATEFIQDLAGRLAHRVQLTTDGHKVYVNAVIDAFGTDIDYAMLHKIHGKDIPDDSRYSPAQCIGTRVQPVCGFPLLEHISTSYVERQKPHDADVHEAVHQAHKRFLDES